jgi:hypothetical protein
MFCAAVPLARALSKRVLALSQYTALPLATPALKVTPSITTARWAPAIIFAMAWRNWVRSEPEGAIDCPSITAISSSWTLLYHS